MHNDSPLTAKLDESNIENLYLLFCNLNVNSVDFDIEKLIKIYLVSFHLGFDLDHVVEHFNKCNDPDFDDLKCIYHKNLREKRNKLESVLSSFFPDSSFDERSLVIDSILSIR